MATRFALATAPNTVSSASTRRSQTCKEANGKSWACGRAAKARLTTLVKGGKVNCTAREKDRFGRIVAVCSAEGVPDLGDAMVRQGYAIDLGGEAGNPYQQAEVEAQRASAAYGAEPSTGRQTGAGPSTRERIDPVGPMPLPVRLVVSARALPGQRSRSWS